MTRKTIFHLTLILSLLMTFAVTASAKTPSIVGGVEATPGDWPSMTALMTRGESNGFNAQFCGGNLIAPGWVLTAAHCMRDENGNKVTADVVDVTIGRHTLSSNEGERIAVAEIIEHPNYNNDTVDNDIALLRLSRASTQPTIGLVTPNMSVSAAGTSSTVTGWGTLTEGGSVPDGLHQVSVPLVSTASCNAVVDGVTGNMICAGFKEGGKDSCQGDSGGPLHVRNAADTAWLQVGVVSWGNGCAVADAYGVYAKVENYINWITSHTGALPGTNVTVQPPVQPEPTAEPVAPEPQPTESPEPSIDEPIDELIDEPTDEPAGECEYYDEYYDEYYYDECDEPADEPIDEPVGEPTDECEYYDEYYDEYYYADCYEDDETDYYDEDDPYYDEQVYDDVDEYEPFYWDWEWDSEFDWDNAFDWDGITATEPIENEMYCNDTVSPIDDTQTVVSPIVIDGEGFIDDIDISLDISHDWIGDLIIALINLDTGETVDLVNDFGTDEGHFGCDSTNMDMWFDDEAEAAAECTNSMAGTHQPNVSLDTFDGADLAGRWALRVSDSFDEDTGSLNQWCMRTKTVDTASNNNVPLAINLRTAQLTETSTPFSLIIIAVALISTTMIVLPKTRN